MSADASALRRLADAAGILPEYLDQTGRHVRVTSDDTRRALLAAMGLPAATEAEARESLERLRAEERGEGLAPVWVVRHDDLREGTPIWLLDDALRGHRWQAELLLEDGTVARAEGDGTDAPRLPALPPIGYHRLRLAVSTPHGEAVASQTIVVAPPRCTLPADLLGDRRAFGVWANLYSVRSEANWGIGDLGDLACLAEWTARAGAQFVGVNPLHALLDRGADISPYSPVSRLFRNAIYLDVGAVARRYGVRCEEPADVPRLRGSTRVEYEAVWRAKREVLRAVHRRFMADGRSDHRAAYDAFVAAREPELTQYATFMAIGDARERAGESPAYDWRGWPTGLRDPRSPAVRQSQAELADGVAFHRWLQFEMDQQLGAVAERARDAGMGIGVYQDLAIGTSPSGSDAWSMPELFVTGASIGAPPDPYASRGQNWGLPPLDPRVLRRDCYRYFVRLLRAGFEHAGALRLDHAMGLFRLFWIPEGADGCDGAYVRYPADDLLGILALESVRHQAIVVGEDLGTVPPEVPPAFSKWGILSSKVLYFEREHDGRFKPASGFEPQSLATANTHDMASLAGFWRGRDVELRREVGLIASDAEVEQAWRDREEEKRKLTERLAHEGLLDAGEGEPSPRALRTAVHRFLCSTPAALVGLSLDDVAGEAEPVNVPGVGHDQFPSWTRRMATSLEELAASDEALDALDCGRGGA